MLADHQKMVRTPKPKIRSVFDVDHLAVRVGAEGGPNPHRSMISVENDPFFVF